MHLARGKWCSARMLLLLVRTSVQRCESHSAMQRHLLQNRRIRPLLMLSLLLAPLFSQLALAVYARPTLGLPAAHPRVRSTDAKMVDQRVAQLLWQPVRPDR